MKSIIIAVAIMAAITMNAMAAETVNKPAVATPAVTKADAGKPAQKKPVPKPTRDPVAEKKKKCAANPKDAACKKKK